jgi:hypothetical protein
MLLAGDSGSHNRPSHDSRPRALGLPLLFAMAQPGSQISDRPVSFVRGETGRRQRRGTGEGSAFLKERVLSTPRRPQGGTLLGLLRLQ